MTLGIWRIQLSPDNMMGVFQDKRLTNLCQCFNIFAGTPGLLHIDKHCQG